MVKELYAFSQDGCHFAFSGCDGKLRVWETSSSNLTREFTPNLHLQSQCTALCWVTTLNSTVQSWKNRKRKQKAEVKMIAMGTLNGSIALYSLAEADIVSTLEPISNSTIRCIQWLKDHGLFSLSSNSIYKWDVDSKNQSRILKCGKEKTTSFLITKDGELCVTGSCNLKVWQLQSKTLLRTLIGHSSEVRNLVLINHQYFISSAENERHLAAWSLAEERTEPVGRFTLTDSATPGISISESKGFIRLAAVTQAGALHVFQHQLNGKCEKSIKPSVTVEIALESSSSQGVQSVPILAANFQSPNNLSIAYGNLVNLSFELVDTKKAVDGHLILTRQEPKKAQVTTSNLKVSEAIVANAEYVSVNGALKRKHDHKVDIPMEERLDKLSIEQTEVGTSKVGQKGLASLLIQGLESKDRSLLETVLCKKDPNVIRETVNRLPLHALRPLIGELIKMLYGKTIWSSLAGIWLKEVVATHAGQLLADSSSCESLLAVHSLLESRLLLFPSLSRLSGRLDLILQQLQEPQHIEGQNEALLVYQDEDSSDEGSSVFGEVELSETEDRWEELSDEESEDEIEDAAMSS